MALYDYTPDINPLDDEEERRRREREIAAMAAENEPMGRGPVAPDFGSVVGQAVDQRIGAAQNRLAQAGQMFTDPAAAFQQRLMGQTEQPNPADTEVKTQTVKTYGDGSQERVVKTQVPPVPMMGQPAPQTPQPMPMMGPVAPDAQEAQQQAQAFAQQMAQYQQQAPARGPSLTTPIPGMPDNLPAQGVIPAEAAQQRPVIAQPMQPGPGVQVAGPAVMPAAAAPGASLAQMSQAAPAPAPAPAPVPTAAPEPAWLQAANAAGTDLDKLFDVAAKFPESRRMIMEKTKQAVQNNSKQEEANGILKAAQEGDLKAMNKIQQAIKPETSKPKEEVTVNDYLKAVLYSRLGLTELAQQQQQKILGKETKFGQITVGNSNWQVETNSSGDIVRAKDDEGNFATAATLNKLRAAGQKFGSQAYSSTGGSVTIPTGQPDAGEEYRTVFNSTTGNFENKIITGKNAGNLYTGPAGLEKRVGTNAAVALNDAFIKFQTAPSTAAATEALKTAALLGPVEYNQALAFVQRTQPQIFGQIQNTLPGALGQTVTPPAPGAGATATPADATAAARVERSIAEVDRQIARATQSTAVDPTRQAQQLQVLNDERNRLLASRQSLGAAPAVGGGGNLLGATESTKANVAIAKEKEVERNKDNQVYSTELANARKTAAPQTAIINRLQGSIDKNPSFWGIDTNSPAWTAFVDINSSNENKERSLNQLARNMNIPQAKRAEFDQAMNDYRNLQVNAITGSGLTASQTNTEKESQRVTGTIGSIGDKPAAARAALEYALAKIEYTDAKANAWAQARKLPGVDRLQFENQFDAQQGEKIFADANKRIEAIVAGKGPAVPAMKEGETSVSRTGRPIVVRNGRWEYQ